MALPLVAVEIAPPDAAPALKQSLLEACGRAAEERCVEAQGEVEPNVVAIVSWQDPLHARLEVALRREQRWVVRTMAFVDQDAPEERWRAVGLVIGTLGSLIAHSKEPAPGETPRVTPVPPTPQAPVAPSSGPSPAPAPSDTTRLAPPSETTPDHVETPTPGEPSPASEKPRKAWIGAAIVMGSALDRGSPRLGAELDGHLHLGSGVYALAGFAYSTALARIDGVQTSFAEGFAGLLYEGDLGHGFAATLHVEALGERFSPSITSGDGGPTEGERWLGGARAGVDVFYWRPSPFGFFLGGAAKWTAGATDVQASGQYVGSAPTLGYVVRAGTAFGFR